MPEGPEIRLAADAVARVLVGREIVAASLNLPQLKRFEKRLLGATVTAVDTRGKAMLTRFDIGLSLYSHNQLYGRWYTTRRPRLPQTRRQQRVALHTETHSALLYSASDIEILTLPQWQLPSIIGCIVAEVRLYPEPAQHYERGECGIAHREDPERRPIVEQLVQPMSDE